MHQTLPQSLTGSGYLLAFLVILGGFFFSVGNIAGAALGLNALFGLDTKWAVFKWRLGHFDFASKSHACHADAHDRVGIALKSC